MGPREDEGMDCVNCGWRLPEDARFCDQCGVRQQPTEEPAVAPLDTRGAASFTPAEGVPEPWEYCEIMVASTGSSYAFEAVVTEPHGGYVIDAVSKMPHDDPSTTNQMYLTQLVTRIIAEGWEPQPKGAAWYAHRFRRYGNP